jgi:2-dehydro-3-deoxyphosphooctonate aldolase (KDO 8-P synthase)
MTNEIQINDNCIAGGNRRFLLIAGPCAIETEAMTMQVASFLKKTCEELNIAFVFKSSFDKANRTSSVAPRGVGIEEGLRILKKVKDELNVPVLTDVHESWQCERVAEIADILQIPAFLSRQTDLLVAAARTGRVVHVKKGQFMAPWDMKNVILKLEETGNHRIMIGERGSSFGYNNLVVDMTGLVEMRSYGYPVVFDATHSVQKPGGQGTSTGGNREMVPYLMRAALAVGVDVIFAEVHPDPDKAFSDGPNQIRLDTIRTILEQAVQVDDLTKGFLKAGNQPTAAIAASVPSTEKAYTTKRKDIRLFLTDVDGVQTDGGMYYFNSRDEAKRFHAHDGMGLQILRRSGMKTGFITSEETLLVENRFKKLKLDYLVQGKRDGGKLASALEICQQEGISLEQVAYIGDDVNCLDLLEKVGWAACPNDAVKAVKAVPGITILTKKGGEGCVREFIDLVMGI